MVVKNSLKDNFLSHRWNSRSKFNQEVYFSTDLMLDNEIIKKKLKKEIVKEKGMATKDKISNN